MKKTIKARVLALLERGEILTAMEAAHKTRSKWSTTSSLLYKMFRDRKVDRIPNYGPLGGYGYFLAKYSRELGRVGPINSTGRIPIEPERDRGERLWPNGPCGDEGCLCPLELTGMRHLEGCSR